MNLIFTLFIELAKFIEKYKLKQGIIEFNVFWKFNYYCWVAVDKVIITWKEIFSYKFPF